MSSGPTPPNPITLGQLREVIQHLPDDAVIDITFNKDFGYVYEATIEEDFNGKLLLSLTGIGELKIE